MEVVCSQLFLVDTIVLSFRVCGSVVSVACFRLGALFGPLRVRLSHGLSPLRPVKVALLGEKAPVRRGKEGF